MALQVINSVAMSKYQSIVELDLQPPNPPPPPTQLTSSCYKCCDSLTTSLLKSSSSANLTELLNQPQDQTHAELSRIPSSLTCGCPFFTPIAGRPS
ncbi:hypothetical protein BaRGS_00024303 [Batillaria attramentaria]|uniref:Uncharacterized protein n=1 Tax=Batillaria attramentaria TaxID=370345 RepID=A0ABD0KBE6_9CAEN